MFGFLKKKKPKELELNYELSCKIASTLEGFVLHCGDDWSLDKLKNYTLCLYQTGGMSIVLNDHVAANEEEDFTIPLSQIKAITTLGFMNSGTVNTFSLPSVPFVNPAFTPIAEEIIEYAKEEKVRRAYRPIPNEWISGVISRDNFMTLYMEQKKYFEGNLSQYHGSWERAVYSQSWNRILKLLSVDNELRNFDSGFCMGIVLIDTGVPVEHVTTMRYTPVDKSRVARLNTWAKKNG